MSHVDIKPKGSERRAKAVSEDCREDAETREELDAPDLTAFRSELADCRAHVGPSPFMAGCQATDSCNSMLSTLLPNNRNIRKAILSPQYSQDCASRDRGTNEEVGKTGGKERLLRSGGWPSA